MTPEECFTCVFWRRLRDHSYDDPRLEWSEEPRHAWKRGSYYSGPAPGVCRRHPAHASHGGDDWCGEYRRENTTHNGEDVS